MRPSSEIGQLEIEFTERFGLEEMCCDGRAVFESGGWQVLGESESQKKKKVSPAIETSRLCREIHTASKDTH